MENNVIKAQKQNSIEEISLYSNIFGIFIVLYSVFIYMYLY